MIDETGCGKVGLRTFCCPATATLPSCGWYTHNNGNCNSECPESNIEIGSNNMYCKKIPTYQAACCDAKGGWGPQPKCEDAQACPISDPKKIALLGKASSGSGASVYNANYFGQISAGAPQERKYCYDDSNKKERSSNCQWYSGIGKFITGAPKYWCISGSPTGKIRVGTGHHEKDDCALGSVKAFCCEPNAYTTVKTETPKLTLYRDAMEDFIKNPRCILPVPFDAPTSAAKIKRDLTHPLDVTYTLLLALLTARSRESGFTEQKKRSGTRQWVLSLRICISQLHTIISRASTAGLHKVLTSLLIGYYAACGAGTRALQIHRRKKHLSVTTSDR
jgi:hypothetical protein